MSRGDAAYALQHKHGVQGGAEPAAPETVLQRVIAIEARVAALEAKREAKREAEQESKGAAKPAK